MGGAQEKTITVESTVPGYAHTKFSGTCSGNVTGDDLRQKFAHPYFGGRIESLSGGRFVYCRHDD